jgi:hypothetical protein
MKQPPYTNLAIFFLFFALSLIEAFKKQDYLSASIFLALGTLSFWSDRR